MKNSRPGLEVQLSTITSRISWRIGWTRWETDGGPSQDVMKFDTHDRMQTFEVARTDFRDSAKFSRWPHGNTWADLMDA